jgi:hypothetical protein
MLETIKLLQLIQVEKRQVNAVFLLNVSKNVHKELFVLVTISDVNRFMPQAGYR